MDWLNEIKNRQIKYFRHINSHDAVLKTILQGKVEIECSKKYCGLIGRKQTGGQRPV
uniref:Uncharacterized protein n=1 Tax=Arion vulgaris TaxID=1028688 RepID=A0A0B6Z5G2_9EUPU